MATVDSPVQTSPGPQLTPNAIQGTKTADGARTRRIVTGGGIAGVLLVVALVLSTFVASWSPLMHWTCGRESLVVEQPNAFVPTVLVNSPYGGEASGEGLLPWYFPGMWNGPPPPPEENLKVGWGTNASNGSAAGAFFTVNVSVYRDASSIQLGPGPNAPCSRQYSVGFQSPTLYKSTAATIATLNHMSDRGEATNVTIFGVTPGSPAYFNNSFTTANRMSVSTCGLGSLVLPIVATGLTIYIHANFDGGPLSIPYVLPVQESYNYTFPANFGVWQIDDLAIGPGAPGGGLAFSYSPCS